MSQTGMIYKLWCKNTLKSYYGSTIGCIKGRLAEHEFKFKNGVKHSSGEIIEGKNYVIEEVELVEYDDKKELREREKFYIINDKNCINKNIPNRTSKDWHELHPDYNKQYYQNNKDKYKVYMRSYYLSKKGVVFEPVN
jgi:hypothetical protein